MATVCVATPHGGMVRPDFYRHLLTMQMSNPQHQYTQVEVDTMIVSKARNVITELSLTLNPDVIWFVDNDVLVPPEAAKIVDNALKLGVVSGVYFNRRLPFTPQVFRLAKEPEHEGMYWPLIDYPADGLEKVDAVGAGCLAIRIDVFTQLKDYWTHRFEEAALALVGDGFRDPIVRAVKLLSPWFEFFDRKGEDMWFCEMCRGAGIDIWVDWSVKCLHMSEVQVSEQHFLAVKASGALDNAPPEALLQPQPEVVLNE